MKNLIIEIPDDIPKGRYALGLVPIGESTPPTLPPVTPPDPPPVVDPPVVEPPDIPIDPEMPIRERLKELFMNPERWTDPVEVWEFNEPSGGVFVPISRNEYLQQDRAGGKIRWFLDGVKRNSFLRDTRGFEIGGYLHDAKYHDGVLYAVIKVEDQIWLGKCEDQSESLNIHLFQQVIIPGALDTKHALEISRDDYYAIYGRLRHAGVDWSETDEIMGRRRGVSRTMQDNDVSSPKHVYFDPAREQPGYEHNEFRVDYYATRLCHIKGVDVSLLSGYQKNEKRRPSTRPERLAGTGPIIPIVALGREILSHTKTPVPLHLFERRTTWEEAHPYEPEVGQMYGVGITYDPLASNVDLYFNKRVGTHYLEKKSDNYPNCKVYRISAKL